MDNNMNVVDYNNMNQNNINAQQPINPMGPMPEQPVPQPVNPMGPMPEQPVPQPVNPVGPIPEQPVPQPVNPGEIPVINVEQTPSEVFGQQVNVEQPNDPTKMNQMIDSINMQQQPEQPKYGYATNEQKANLNDDSNINLKFVIIIAILIFAFIMALPYLSSMLDKQ